MMLMIMLVIVIVMMVFCVWAEFSGWDANNEDQNLENKEEEVNIRRLMGKRMFKIKNQNLVRLSL
jgi:high-affinity Fe2+/Pb2+ permease